MVSTSDLPDRPFTAPQFMALGLSRHDLREALTNRVVRRVLHGVYVRGDLPDTIALRAQAAALVISAHSALRDRTAAWLLGVDVLRVEELEVLPPLETCVLRWRARTQRQECDGNTRDLEAQDVMRVHGLSVTTPLRTAMDLGCALARRDALAALDAFMRICGLTQEDFARQLPRYRRRRGVVQLRALLALADARAESPGESWTRLEVLDHQLPQPELQWWVEVDGAPTFRLDLAWPRHRVALEYDGEEFHSSPQQRAHDRARREWLRAHGWTVVVVDKTSFTAQAVDSWIADLRSALRLGVHAFDTRRH